MSYAPALGGNVLHRLGEFLAVRHADDIERDAGFLFPQILDRGAPAGKGWASWPIEPSDRPRTILSAPAAFNCLAASIARPFRRIGPILVALGSRRNRSDRRSCRGQRVGRKSAAWTDELRRDAHGGRKREASAAGCQQFSPRKTDQFRHVFLPRTANQPLEEIE
jgi:hypothetical protein